MRTIIALALLALSPLTAQDEDDLFMAEGKHYIVVTDVSQPVADGDRAQRDALAGRLLDGRPENRRARRAIRGDVWVLKLFARMGVGRTVRAANIVAFVAGHRNHYALRPTRAKTGTSCLIARFERWPVSAKEPAIC